MDLKDDGAASSFTFSSSNDFDAFLARQGAAGIEEVGSGIIVASYLEVKEGATYAVVSAGSSYLGSMQRLQSSVDSAEKAVIDNVSEEGGLVWAGVGFGEVGGTKFLFDDASLFT